MAIQADLIFKGVPISGAYLVISDVRGGKAAGHWVGVVSVFASRELSIPTKTLIREAVEASPAVPAKPATEEDMYVPGRGATGASPAEYSVTPADPVFSFQIEAPYDPAEPNPYALLYPALKAAPALGNVADV